MSMRVAGIMSGTSLDGIDVAIVDIKGRKWDKRISVAAYATTPYAATVRRAILGVSNTQTHTGEIARLHFLLGELYAEAVRNTCRQKRIALRSIDLIGCHGQTIFHEGDPVPFLGHCVASTLQIGEAAVIADRTGIPVVSDFRPGDIAAGGRGAPLVPSVDYFLFRHRKRGRIALNIGGIANITAIGAGAPPERVIAFDTGPGNMVMDALVAEMTGGKRMFDRGGRIAAKGRVNDNLLAELLSDSFYRRKPPKTAGREQYGAEFAARLRATGLPRPDLIATAAALTAESIASGIERFVAPKMNPDELIVSGGGAHNPILISYLTARLPEIEVSTSADFGIDIDAKEAIAFAILAYETWHARPSNLPSATGARHPAVLGKVTR